MSICYTSLDRQQTVSPSSSGKSGMWSGTNIQWGKQQKWKRLWLKYGSRKIHLHCFKGKKRNIFYCNLTLLRKSKCCDLTLLRKLKCTSVFIAKPITIWAAFTEYKSILWPWKHNYFLIWTGNALINNVSYLFGCCLQKTVKTKHA